MTRIYKTIFVLACLILAAMACRKDPDPRKEDHGFQLNAMDLQMDGSRQPGAKSFENGIKYAMFIVETPQTSGQRDWSDPILHGQGEENNGYIRLPKNVSYEDRTFDFYGLTLGSTDPIYPSEAIEYTPDNASSPIYYLKATPRESANGKGTYYDLPDLRRSELLNRNANNSEYILSLPFKHCLAKLRLEVVRQDEGELNGVSILSVKLRNAYSAGRLNVEDNTFDFSDESPVSEDGGILLYEGTENDDIPIEGDSLTETLIFPYDPALHGGTPLQIEIETDTSSIGNNGTSICNIELPASGNNEKPTPLKIKSNVIYTIRINVTTDEVRVLTIVPSYYEWLDTEVAEFEMGIPVNFNGVLWSDRNLGATNPNPLESADAWDESVGYFYQFGRNIPYFPNDYQESTRTVDLNTDLNIALSSENPRDVYPVIDISSWNLGQLSDYIEFRPSRFNPTPWTNSNIIWQIGELPSTSHDDKLLGYYSTSAASIPNADINWQNKEDHPCPAGWRLPTASEWLSIMPYSPIAGNFAMRCFTSVGSDGSWSTANTFSEPDFENVFEWGNLPTILLPTGNNSPYQRAEQAYTGSYPYLRREESNDPVNNRNSVYIISFDDQMDPDGTTDLTTYTCTNGSRVPTRDNGNTAYPNYTYNWGRIYCIKNVGTSEAYRIRWSIQFAGTQAQITKDPRCVVVIERFPATASDRLTISNFKDYDWTHPVEVMYLPVCGLVSPVWPQLPNNGGSLAGQLFNIGGEVAYASSDPYNSNLCQGCWIKTVGDNHTNMQISAGRATKAFGFQVRCVRDTEY